MLLALVLLLSFVSQAQKQQRITLNPSLRPFYHGVESGDPMPDRMIIWSRLTPDTGVTGNIDVYWQVATDTGFLNVVNYGKVIATDQNHYTVKVDVCGLQPSTYYYYMFYALGRNSIIGRTKTAPDAVSDNDSVRFAVVSCASWEHGYFNAYEKISERNDVDAVVHLGDYIYEYATGDFSDNINGRTYDPPAECIDEVGYELRYSQYKLDDQLRRLHQLYPFITVWDDHETANDAWREGAQNHTPGTEGSFTDRKHVATNTYFKWMPIRKPDPMDTIRIFRKLRYGKLLDLIMLDTRLYDRDEQDLGASDDSTHHLLGPVERAWFLQQLSDTATRWKIIGNQIMFAPLRVFGQPVNSDQWDGYNYERQIIQDHILNNNINDVVIITGDIHTSWCNDVPGPNYNSGTGAGSVCVEFVGTSVTSFNSPLPVGQNLIKTFNPHMKFINLDDKGYYVLDVKKNRTQADYRYISTVSQIGANETFGPNYYVNHLQRNLIAGTPITNAPKIPAPVPPLLPRQNINVKRITSKYVTTVENTQVLINIIPGFNVCPLVSMTVLPAAHGGVISLNGSDVTYVPSANYNGPDTVPVVVCTNENPPVCDTMYVFITVFAVDGIDTVTVAMKDNETYTACVSFDDLTGPVQVISFSQTLNGTLTVNDSCFAFLSDSAFTGTDVLTAIACDSSQFCDTVVYIFKITNPGTIELVHLTLNKNSNITYCPVFDDLSGSAVTISVIKPQQSGTLNWQGDTCFKYFPFYNYVGNDTLILKACKTGNSTICDTLIIVFHIEQPSSVSEPLDMVLFGLYPNPVGDKLIVQYYLYEPGKVIFDIYDALGRLISTDEINGQSNLQYAQLNTSHLSGGTYTVEVRNGKKEFRRKIVKQ